MTKKIGAALSERAAQRRESKDHGLTVIENSAPSKNRANPADTCRYIEEVVRELRGVALRADQELIAFLLGMAAVEARLEAARMQTSPST